MSSVPPPLPPPVLPYGAVRCPRCGHGESKPAGFTWWGGVLGPKLLSHVTCRGCGYGYNGKTGRPNTNAIIIYTVVCAVIGLVVGFIVFFGMRL